MRGECNDVLRKIDASRSSLDLPRDRSGGNYPRHQRFQCPGFGLLQRLKKSTTSSRVLQAGEYLFVAMDYDPTSLAELNPMAEAILKHAFSRNEKVVIVTLAQFGPGMVEEITARLAKEYNKVRGVDYVFLGYRPYPAITILAMGVDFRSSFPGRLLWNAA